MENIDKTSEELEDMDTTENGKLIRELINKVNEIVEWINGNS